MDAAVVLGVQAVGVRDRLVGQHRGFHYNSALVTCAHAFLTEERLRPPAPRPV